jgi:hypothetical protein
MTVSGRGGYGRPTYKPSGWVYLPVTGVESSTVSEAIMKCDELFV